MQVRLTVLGSVLLLLGACKQPTPSAPPKPSVLGESCTKSDDCDGRLRCVAAVCAEAPERAGPASKRGLRDLLLGDSARIETAKVLVSRVEKAVSVYLVTHRKSPDDLRQLAEKQYVKAGQLSDPWGVPLVYRPGPSGDVDDFVLCSNGPDGQSGTADDICADRE